MQSQGNTLLINCAMHLQLLFLLGNNNTNLKNYLGLNIADEKQW